MEAGGGGGIGPPPELAQARERFLELVAEIRPELHRYCARLTGSIVDGEDVVQDTLAKAYYAVSMAAEMPPLRPLLFKIAHNTALDVLRRYERRNVELVGDWSDHAAGAAASGIRAASVRIRRSCAPRWARSWTCRSPSAAR